MKKNYEKYGKLHNELVLYAVKSISRKGKKKDQICDLICRRLKSKSLYKKLKLRRSNRAYKEGLMTVRIMDNLLKVAPIDGLIELIASNKKYKKLFKIVRNKSHRSPQDKVSELRSHKKKILRRKSNIQNENELFATEIAINSYTLIKDLRDDGIIEQGIDWREVGAADCAGAIMGLGLGGVGAGGGAALFSAATFL